MQHFAPSVSRKGHEAVLIVVGSDENYSLPLAVTLHSALRHISEGVDTTVLVLDAGITPASKLRIERVVKAARPSAEIRWIVADANQFSHLKTIQWGSSATFLPLLIPSVVVDSEFAIYLDSDVLVLTDLSDLWSIGVRSPDTPVHAVLDYGFRTLGEAFNLDVCARLDMDPDARYFNSGIMFMSLEAWKAEQTSQQAVEFASDHPDVMRFGGDQDALNGVLRGNWISLDPRWNVLVGGIDQMARHLTGENGHRSVRQVKNYLSRPPHILHFSGPQKPWKPGYSPFGKRAYREELRKSGWFDESREYLVWRIQVALMSPYVKLRRFIGRSLGKFKNKARTVLKGRRSTKP